MKRFNFGKVLDGIRQSVSTQPKNESDLVEEKVQPEHFQVAKVVRHGFPFQPTALAYDPIQHLLAIGTRNGSLRIFGRPGVDCHMRHDSDASVIQLVFLVNEGALVSVCADDSLHLWSLRQKHPALLHSLKFNREKITYCHLPFQSKWLYIGTERGNVHVVNVEEFQLSGYIISWNKAIELTRKTHPGPVVHLSDSPIDAAKLLIGFETGAIAYWDLKTKQAVIRCNYSEGLRSISWNSDGKQFMCSHNDGSLTTWNLKSPCKPVSAVTPHAKPAKDGGKTESCKPIIKVEWKTARSGDSFIVFSGGLTYGKAGRTPCLTVMHGKSTTVLEMEDKIIDFVCLCETPFSCELQDPYAIAVLLNSDLVVLDLTSSGYPCFENPYPMDVHESPVSCVSYMADCPTDLIPALFSVGTRQKRSGFSDKEWPITGGEWGSASCSYPELLITGHADGSVKFWDASSVMLQVLYKLKTSRLFDLVSRSTEDEDPFAIEKLYLCPGSQLLCVAGVSGQVILFTFNKQESTAEIPCLEFSIVYEVNDESDALDVDYLSNKTPSLQNTSAQGGSAQSANSSADETQQAEAIRTLVKIKTGPQKRLPGYHAELVCLLQHHNGEPPPVVTSLTLNSSYGVLAFGNDCGLAIVDYIQKTVLLKMGTPDLYGSGDPYQRALKLGKRTANQQHLGVSTDVTCDQESNRCRSPIIDQSDTTSIPSPTAASRASQKRLLMQRSRSQGGTSHRISKSHSVTPDEENEVVRPLAPTTTVVENNAPVVKEKTDNQISRSRSSSSSSLDNITSEAVQLLTFAESFTKKADTFTCPCLWVGTSLGSVLLIVLTLPPSGERSSQPVIVSPSGTILRLKGAIQCISFLDSMGTLVPPECEPWLDPSASKETYEKDKEKSKQRSADNRPRLSPSESMDLAIDKQYVVLCSEKQIRVLSLPSHACAFKCRVSEESYAVCAEVVHLSNLNSSVLVCYVADGRVMVFSLPSLRQVLCVPYHPLTDLRIARTFQISNNGHAVHMCSPTEIQKITYTVEICEHLQEMQGGVFVAVETPEAPKTGFFKGLFGGNTQVVDRGELFGESNSGKASRTVAQYTPGRAIIDNAQAKAGTAAAEIGKARMALIERGEKLSDVEERTARMLANAENYAQGAHQVMLKYKDKKWYQW